MTSTRASGPMPPACRAATFRRIDSVYFPSCVVRSSNCLTRTNPAPPSVLAARTITRASAGNPRYAALEPPHRPRQDQGQHGREGDREEDRATQGQDRHDQCPDRQLREQGRRPGQR